MRFWPVVGVAAVVAGSIAIAGWVFDRARSGARVAGAPAIYRTSDGLIITDSADKARWAGARLAEAAAHFRRQFGIAPGPGVIVEMRYGARLASVPAAQKRWTLAWLTDYFGDGPASAVKNDGHHFDNGSGLRHELNHVFFTAIAAKKNKVLQYGGDAPDWLDEAVALSAETPAVKARRRAHFHMLTCAGRLVPLSRFIGQEHPLFASAAMRKLIAERRTGKNGPTMISMSVDELGVPRDALLDFYAQANAVAEFMAESSGDPAFLRRVAASPGRADGADWQDQPWARDLATGGRSTIEERFAAWAWASARAARPGCGPVPAGDGAGRTR